MGERVTLELPTEVARRVKELAARTRRRPEDILVEWLDRAAAEFPVEALSDDEILSLCDAEMEVSDQAELSQLLVGNREGTLTEAERSRLDELMQRYRYGLVRKAQAWKVAIERGLRAALN
jgi:predicted transcriptional regulator